MIFLQTLSRKEKFFKKKYLLKVLYRKVTMTAKKLSTQSNTKDYRNRLLTFFLN